MKKKKREDGPLTSAAKRTAEGPLKAKKTQKRKGATESKSLEAKKLKLQTVKDKAKEILIEDKATEAQWSSVNIEDEKLLQNMGLASLEVMEDDESWTIVRSGKRRIEETPLKQNNDKKEKKKKKKTSLLSENQKENIKLPYKKCKRKKQKSDKVVSSVTETPVPQTALVLSDQKQNESILQDVPLTPTVEGLTEGVTAKAGSDVAATETTAELPTPSAKDVERPPRISVAERKLKKKMLRKEKIAKKKLAKKLENKPLLSDEMKEKQKTKRKERVTRAKLRKLAEMESEFLDTLVKEQAEMEAKSLDTLVKEQAEMEAKSLDVSVKEQAESQTKSLETSVIEHRESRKAEEEKEDAEKRKKDPETIDMLIESIRAQTSVTEEGSETTVIQVESQGDEDIMESQGGEDIMESLGDEDIAESLGDEDIAESMVLDETKDENKENEEKKNVDEEMLEDDSVENILEDCEDTDTPTVIELTVDEKERGKLWIEMGVCEALVKGLVELGFTTPTPIQRSCIPAGLLKYKDVIGAAETGSGKTLAFGIPLIQRVLDLTPGQGMRGLVMAPTRELALQVTDHLKKAAKYTSVNIVPIVGGIAQPKQLRLLSYKPDIIVATPGRCWQLIQENEYLQQTSSLRFLVIDEADRMVEDGHFVELTDIIGRLPGPDVRSTFLFSATLTFAIEHMGDRANKKSKKKKNKNEKKLSKKDAGLEMLVRNIGIKDKIEKVDFTLKKGTAETLTETYLLCDITDKDLYLYYLLLNHPGKTLVFCNSIDGVMNLVHIMQLLQLSVHPLHSALQQRQRFKFLDRFKERDSCTLIATDVAARGLDIAAVDTVIHYQLPPTREAYIHRSGRTARADNPGLSIGLVGPKDFKSYKKISSNMTEFPMEINRLKHLRPALQVARQIFKIERLHTRPDQADAKLEALARDAGLDTTLEKSLPTGDKTTKKEVKGLKAQLKQILAQPIVDPMSNQKYLNKEGHDDFQTLSSFSIGRKALEHNFAKNKT